ncbi:MAG: signal peptidase I, partial [Nitrospinaceae bacterium]
YFFFPEVPQRYDIIVFKYPRDESRDFIKRVIGLPGETIEVRRQEVFINGKKLDDPAANHTIPPSSAPDDPRHNLAPVRIPEGHVFVLGDNRENSQDSRYWGVLDIRKIRGKAQRIYWSWKAKPEMCWICGSVRWDRLGQALE